MTGICPDKAAPIAGLAAAACVAWLGCPVPPAHFLSLTGLMLRAGAYLLAIILVNAVVTALLARRRMWRMSMVAAWLGPFAIFLVERSLWAAVVAALLVATLLKTPDSKAADASPLMRHMPSSLCAAACVQGAAVAGLADRVLLAAVFMAIATMFVMWRVRKAGVPAGRSAATPSWIPVMLALALVVAGLLPFVKRRPRSGGNAAPADYAQQNSTSSANGGIYRGVILWPDRKPQKILAPPRPVLQGDLFGSKNSEPLIIPFDGVYWMFQPPDHRPPVDSIVSHGSPDAATFRSAFSVPLWMEAHQNFLTSIDLNCCSRIEIEIRNADRYLRSVSIELILENTLIEGRPSQSLGVASVLSAPRGTPLDERLSFEIPTASAIRQFDEVTVRFRRNQMWADRSAKIAIERFILVPLRH